MKGLSWKLLTVGLLIYIWIAGLLVPLRPGIFSVSPGLVEIGSTVELDVKLFQTDLELEEEVVMWLKYDTACYLKTTSAEVLGPRRVKATFDLPENLPKDEEALAFALIFSSPSTKAIVQPSAVLLQPNKGSSWNESPEWTKEGRPHFEVLRNFSFPYRNIVMETIRNLFYHVPLWFAMIILLGISAFWSIKVLYYEKWEHDIWVRSLNWVGLVYGLLGLTTGMIWADASWGKFWSWDIKQTTAAMAVFMYAAYFFIRLTTRDEVQKKRLGNSFNLFSFAMLVPLLFIIPRLMDSLHPGSGGNPAFAQDDLDNTMRLVFYPAVFAFTLLGYWIASLYRRVWKIEDLKNSSKYL